MNWRQPICERCWIERNTITADNGAVIGIRPPTRVVDAVIEFCAWCGNPTIFGVYVRQNPNKVPHPAGDDQT